jgi:hypothetical protein
VHRTGAEDRAIAEVAEVAEVAAARIARPGGYFSSAMGHTAAARSSAFHRCSGGFTIQPLRGRPGAQSDGLLARSAQPPWTTAAKIFCREEGVDHHSAFASGVAGLDVIEQTPPA